MSRRALISLAALALAPAWMGVAAGSAVAAGWRLPVRGGADVVVGRFAFSRARPFAAGARRGVDLRAAPGSAVLAPCTGRVSFAGSVPGRGAGVTVRCGPLVGTVLGLERVAVPRGAPVLRGARVGAAGGSGRVRLGARRGADRFGYVDPLTLLGGEDRAPPLVGPPSRSRWAPRVPHGVAVRRVAARADAGARGAGPVAWLGGGLLAAALGAGVTRRRAVRRVASATPCPSTSPRPSTT